MSVKRGKAPVHLDEMTSADFAFFAGRNALAILPVGSTEEHGVHLPLGTDAMQAEDVARRIASEFEAVICPPVRYGECRSARNFPGTISLSFETLYSLAFDLMTELARNRIQNILVITGHAGSGHMAALRLAAQRALEKYPKLKLMVVADYDIAYELRGKEFPESDGHGGMIETSRMLNIRPDLVKKGRPSGKTWAPEFMVVPDPERYFPTGIRGETKDASAELGKRVDDYVVERLVKLVSENFGLKRRPRGRGR